MKGQRLKATKRWHKAGLLSVLASIIAFTSLSPLEANDIDWNGYWAIEAFNFMIEVDATANTFEVIPVLPATLPWTPDTGEIRDGKGYINVEYQGVSADLLVELTDANTALVQPVNCMPEYHMLCALAQNQRAILTRVNYQANSSN